MLFDYSKDGTIALVIALREGHADAAEHLLRFYEIEQQATLVRAALHFRCRKYMSLMAVLEFPTLLAIKILFCPAQAVYGTSAFVCFDLFVRCIRIRHRGAQSQCRWVGRNRSARQSPPYDAGNI